MINANAPVAHTALQPAQFPFKAPLVLLHMDVSSLTSNQKDPAVFSSFYHLIKELRDNEVPFRLILRSFGPNGSEIVAEIEKNMPFATFEKPGFFKKGKFCFQENFYDNAQAIYDLFKSRTFLGHFFVKDDAFAKKFPLDLRDKNVISIFFDENVKKNTDSELNCVDPVDVRMGESLSCIDLVRKKMVNQVDKIKAHMDVKYFSKAVNECLEMHGFSLQYAHLKAAELPAAKETGLSQKQWLEIYWRKKEEEKGMALSDVEKAWDIPAISDPFGWDADAWQTCAAFGISESCQSI